VKGFVLSEYRATSRAGKSIGIKTNGINTAGNRCVKGELFSMCQNVGHVDKQIVNWVQMYNNY
jgi:hypothetical protein